MRMVAGLTSAAVLLLLAGYVIGYAVALRRYAKEPDYDAAMTVLTMELVAWRKRITHLEPAHVLLENPSGMPLYATRQKIARKVVDAANREEKP